MGSWGALIMGFFGAGSAAAAAVGHGARGAVSAVPAAAFALIAAAAVRVISPPSAGIAPLRGKARAIPWRRTGEGAGRVVAADLVADPHRPDPLLPAMAPIVGPPSPPIALAGAFLFSPLLGRVSLVIAVAGARAGTAPTIRRDRRAAVPDA